jgi:hypothetical protein
MLSSQRFRGGSLSHLTIKQNSYFGLTDNARVTDSATHGGSGGNTKQWQHEELQHKAGQHKAVATQSVIM